jgi:hypothetical protein
MLALTTDQTTTIQLPKHKDQPEAPTFTIRFPSARKNITIQNEINAAIKAEQDHDLEASVNHTARVLDLFIVSQENTGATTISDLLDRLTFNEVWQLIGEARRVTSLEGIDAKKFDSPSPSGGG